MTKLWIGLCALGLAACATAATESADSTSWGKAGVSLSQYLVDAAHCAAVSAPVRAEREALVHAAQRSDQHEQMLEQANRNTEAQARADMLARQHAHDQCLLERGYTHFRLTSEQRAQLATLPQDSEARRDYLHHLASDPAVLAAQAI